MPGKFGTSDNEDGIFASTKATDHVGVFGSHEATRPPTGGGAGGAGVFGLSMSPGGAGVFGANNSDKGVGVQGNGPEVGVSGFSQQGTGLRGVSQSSANFGIFGSNDSPDAPTGGGAGGAGVFGLSVSPGGAGVFGADNSDKGVGVQGNGPEVGVSGFSQQGTGLRGVSQSSANFGIFGSNDSPDAPTGGGAGGAGVFGLSVSPGGAGVLGANNSAKGVGVQGNGPEAGISGFSDGGVGVRAHSNHASGVEGFSHISDQSGIFGMNDAAGQVPDGLNRPAGNGVWGHTKVEKGSGVVGSVEPGLSEAAGITGIGPIAGRFFGDVYVTGKVHSADVICPHGADCAEDFDISGTEEIEPGSVMVINQEGALRQSHQAYDKRVAGVISGAGGYKPGIVLDNQPLESNNRMPIALMGKVYCKVDAQYSPVEIGDLLTTSPTLGYAMKADDPLKAFGAVIGKALRSFSAGQGLIPILIALQ